MTFIAFATLLGLFFWRLSLLRKEVGRVICRNNFCLHLLINQLPEDKALNLKLQVNSFYPGAFQSDDVILDYLNERPGRDAEDVARAFNMPLLKAVEVTERLIREGKLEVL